MQMRLFLASVVVVAAAAAVALAAPPTGCGPNGSGSAVPVAVASVTFQGQMPTTGPVKYTSFALEAGVPRELPSSKQYPAAIATITFVAGEPRFYSSVTATATRALTFTLPRHAGVVVTPAEWIPAGLESTLGAKSFVLPSISKQADVFSLGTRPFTIPVEARSTGVGLQFRLFVPNSDFESGDFVRVMVAVDGAPAQRAALFRWTALRDMRGRWTLVTATVPRTGDASTVSVSAFIEFAGTEASEFVAVSDLSFVRAHDVCVCNAGFTGQQCQTNINECASSPCENGGTCADATNGFSCVCAAGFEGEQCENAGNECASSPCYNGGTCNKGVDSFSCTCAPGYTGAHCQDSASSCPSSPCKNGGTCTEGVGSFICQCPTGYFGEVCDDACASSPCQFGAACTRGTTANRPFICDKFVTLWTTEIEGIADTTSISLPLEDTGTYNFLVDWGDGTSDTITSSSQRQHTYTVPGEYIVTISGTIVGWCCGCAGEDCVKLTQVSQWGQLQLGNSGAYFAVAYFMQVTAVDELDLTGVTNMAGMFSSTGAFNSPIGHWDVSAVTDMSDMFSYAEAFNQSLSAWNVSSVTTMARMFEGASVFNQPIGNWDLSSAVDIEYMFKRAGAFNQPIGLWDVSKVAAMAGMFWDAVSFNQDISAWDTSLAESMMNMFSGAVAFNQPVGDWDVSKVITMDYMFNAATSFNQPIGDWDVSNVLSMSNMFWGAESFNQPIGAWDVSKVTDMGYMFSYALAFNQPIGAWNVGSVTTMYGMLAGLPLFNQPLADWDVSSVTNMGQMFSESPSFNQDLSGWCVAGIATRPECFSCAQGGTSCGSGCTCIVCTAPASWLAASQPQWGVSCD
jgi:surface protein